MINLKCLYFILSSSQTKSNLKMPETIRVRLSHQEINRIVRQHKGYLSKPIQQNLKKLRTIIDEAVDGETNLVVYIYLSDELEEPIELRSGAGDNELLIDIEEDGIDIVWTKQTWWKKAKDFFKAAGDKIMAGLSRLWGNIKSIAGGAKKALTWSS